MIRILVLGGYGGFGGRISRRLAGEGYAVIVAGRSLERAKAFCADDPSLIPAELDRSQIARGLAEHRPAIVVDASGPFQVMDLAVPRACIAAGVHYCDIADSSTFVAAIGVLDDLARTANAVILSGASSVPALSGAVVRELAQDLERVTAVEIAISASNRATAGGSVAAAILGQVGKPFKLRRGGRLETVYGWHELERVSFVVPGKSPVTRRSVALVDVPDVALLPERLPGRPTVTFRAGGELAFQNLALWLLSWLVRWGWIRELGGFARWLLPLQKMTAWVGSDRSAMAVRLFGMAVGRRVERRWTLIAEDGDGPEIPTLAVAPLVARILAGKELFGARDAGRALSLADFESAFAELAISHSREEIVQPNALYRRIIGDRFDDLPHAVPSMHQVLRDGGARGEAEVTGAANPIGALIARVVGFPPAGRHSVHVSFSERGGVERWARNFGSTRFTSELREKDRKLVERFGLARFHFELHSDETGLTMHMRRWSLFGVPLPLAFAPRSLAREWQGSGRFCFDVPIELPLIGRIVHYRGWLSPQA